MKTLQKTLFIALAAFGLAATAHAEKGMDKGMEKDACPAHAGWQRHDPEKMAKFFEKRLGDLHGKLKLTDQQEPAWKNFTDKIKPAPKADRPDFAALSKLPTPERLDRLQALSKEHQEHQAAHIAAVKEFYAQLTPEQQKTFDANFMQGHRGHEGAKEHRHGKPGDKARPDAK